MVGMSTAQLIFIEDNESGAMSDWKPFNWQLPRNVVWFLIANLNKTGFYGFFLLCWCTNMMNSMIVILGLLITFCFIALFRLFSDYMKSNCIFSLHFPHNTYMDILQGEQSIADHSFFRYLHCMWRKETSKFLGSKDKMSYTLYMCVYVWLYELKGNPSTEKHLICLYS